MSLPSQSGLPGFGGPSGATVIGYLMGASVFAAIINCYMLGITENESIGNVTESSHHIMHVIHDDIYDIQQVMLQILGDSNGVPDYDEAQELRTFFLDLCTRVRTHAPKLLPSINEIITNFDQYIANLETRINIEDRRLVHDVLEL